MPLTFYVDESYNNRTFNLGGWLGEESEWNRLQSQWSKRLDLERRKHGSLDRYHASDCSSLRGGVYRSARSLALARVGRNFSGCGLPIR